VITFDREDLELFAAASGDRNPLHTSADYARRTAYGEPVVFGILGAIAALGQLPPTPDRSLSALKLEFRHPLFTRVRYRAEITAASAERPRLTLHDGERLILVALPTFGPASSRDFDPSGPQTIGRAEPANWALDELHEGVHVAGSYAASALYLDRLVERWDLRGKGIDRGQLAVLLWSSYLVGMELPGTRALFWSQELSFLREPAPCGRSLQYAARVTRTDRQLEFVEVESELSSDGSAVAHAKFRAFVRRDSPSVRPSDLRGMVRADGALRGKHAVVIGGSRGLGSAIAQGLEIQGATVLAIQRSAAEAPENPRAVEFMRGDASDETWCRDVLRPKVAGSGLDILICNAAPPIRPLGLSLDEIERFREFTATSLGLVAVPFATLLDLVAKRSGSVVLMSSSYVRTTPADWPHYIAAKSAAEGLTRWAAAKYGNVRFLLARPPRMLTDQTNTPAGRQGAVPVEQVATSILAWLASPAGDRVTLMDDF
jgi:NAD(P)-dependent dehydrogenase (short-subunit alcohol dehydrogenase family)